MGLLAGNAALTFVESANRQLVGLTSGPELLDSFLGLSNGGDERRPTSSAEDRDDLSASLFEREADRDLPRPVDANGENDRRLAASASRKERAAEDRCRELGRVEIIRHGRHRIVRLVRRQV